MKIKSFAILSLIIISFAGSSKVIAMESNNNTISENITIEVKPSTNNSKNFFENPSDVLNGNYREKNIPTQYCDLNSSQYNGNLIEVRSSLLYTNYYFSPNTNGELKIDYWISPINTSGTKMIIKLYNISTRKFVETYTTSGAPTGACVTFRGLNKSQHYAFAFQAIRDPLAYNAVEGTITVYH